MFRIILSLNKHYSSFFIYFFNDFLCVQTPEKPFATHVVNIPIVKINYCCTTVLLQIVESFTDFFLYFIYSSQIIMEAYNALLQHKSFIRFYLNPDYGKFLNIQYYFHLFKKHCYICCIYSNLLYLIIYVSYKMYGNI